MNDREHTAPVTIKLTCKDGLDPRLAALLSMQASRFACDITVAYRGQVANAKSVAAVMGLSAPRHGLVDIHAVGAQAQDAVNALIAVIQDN